MTWKKGLTKALKSNGETWADVESNTLSDSEMETEFDDSYGGVNGTPFTAWTKQHVYFPIQYDGAEWVGGVSRHPDGHPTQHQGGG